MVKFAFLHRFKSQLGRMLVSAPSFGSVDIPGEEDRGSNARKVNPGRKSGGISNFTEFETCFVNINTKLCK